MTLYFSVFVVNVDVTGTKCRKCQHVVTHMTCIRSSVVPSCCCKSIILLPQYNGCIMQQQFAGETDSNIGVPLCVLKLSSHC